MMRSDGPDGLTPEARLLYADLYRAAEQLAYLHAPVECRTSHYGLRFLRTAFPHPPFSPTPLAMMSGLRVLIDPDLPEKRIEFRDGGGNITHSIDLP